ncbi:hypothetical protein RJT34_06618 [Clitoria ternatea]|uniref:Uncharacterized protein n=1 Tax=Clitoria ternatea TaxID=43366 RepID=A0AAN9K2P1_CLITE
MVIGPKEPVAARQRGDLIKEKLAKLELVDKNHLKLMLCEVDSFVIELCCRWQEASMIKLLSKTSEFSLINEKLSGMWKLNIRFEFMDVLNDFFLSKFYQDDDRAKVIEEGL